MDITTRRSHSPRPLSVPARRVGSASRPPVQPVGPGARPFAPPPAVTMKDVVPLQSNRSTSHTKQPSVQKIHTQEKPHALAPQQLKNLEGIVQQKRAPQTLVVAPVAPEKPQPSPVPAKKTDHKKPEPKLDAVKSDAPKQAGNTKKKRRFTWKSAVGYAACVAILSATALLGRDVWTTNNILKAELTATRTALASPSPDVRQSNEGKDEAQVPKDAVKEYKVAPTMPRVITIPKANVYARLLPMDVNPDNSMQSPINIYDAGWYTGSAKPGDPGAAVIDAHASGLTRLGLFAYLDTLKNGDLVHAERGDGQKYTYEVVHVEKVAKDKVDMQKLLRPYDNGAQGLNLITCAGEYLKDEKTFDHRVIVYTKRVE